MIFLVLNFDNDLKKYSECRLEKKNQIEFNSILNSVHTLLTGLKVEFSFYAIFVILYSQNTQRRKILIINRKFTNKNIKENNYTTNLKQRIFTHPNEQDSLFEQFNKIWS